MKLKKEKIDLVKWYLDNALWDYEMSGRSGSEEDHQKAVRYLENAKFSLSLIKGIIEECWTDIKYNIRHYEPEDNLDFIARSIANDVAFRRIAPFQHIYGRGAMFSKKWRIGETLTFKVNI